MTAGTPEDGAEDAPPQSFDERVHALEEVVDDLSTAIVELASGTPAGASAGEAAPGDGQDEDAAAPLPWGARASAEDWRDLAAWVDWLAATYDHQPSRAVLPCWPAHGGVVHELAALRTAWTSAATTDASDEPGDAMAAWHEGLLRPCLTRLREDYQLKACTDRHTPPRPRRLTDHDVLARTLVHAATASPGVDDIDRRTGELR